jgi:hypothetical protein
MNEDEELFILFAPIAISSTLRLQYFGWMRPEDAKAVQKMVASHVTLWMVRKPRM